MTEDNEAEAKERGPQDHWTTEGALEHYGKKYVVQRGHLVEELLPEKNYWLETFCLGVEEPPQNTPETLQDKPEVVSKIDDKEILPTEISQEQENGILKHRGRPRKTEDFSRVTDWRRRKEQQGRLF